MRARRGDRRGWVPLVALLLCVACTEPVPPDRSVDVGSRTARAELVRYFVSYGDDYAGTVEIDMDERTFCSHANVPWARAAQLHRRLRQAHADPVVLTLFEPPQPNRESLCVRGVAPGVLARIVDDPRGHYVDFHESDDASGRTVTGVLGSHDPPFEPLEVEVSGPSQVRGGEVFRLDVTARDGEGEITGLQVRFGDGNTWGGLPFDLVCDGVVGEEDPQEGPSSEEESLRHAYRDAGEYVVRVVATSGGCDAPAEEARAKATITVEGAATTSNGPSRPRAKIGHAYYTGGDRSVLVSDIGGYDDDGYVYWVRIDWGDGSRHRVVKRGFARCRDGRSWPRGWFSDQMRHSYDERGEYPVTVKVRSAGCDGRDEQADRTTRVLEFPPRQGS